MMKFLWEACLKPYRPTVAIAWIVWCCLFVGLPSAGHAEPPRLLHVDDIRPGMKGIGKTVFSGTTIEEFEVEILGVLKNSTPHGDSIMAKVSGGPMPLEQSGVIAGMSGSPIYIDGQLIGALAFIPSIFPQEPMIAGITPIHEMLANANIPASPNAAAQAASGYDFMHYPATGSDFVPIQTPLTVSGIDPRALALLNEQVAPLNLLPVQGGGVAANVQSNAEVEIEPGAAVGMQLIRGDMTASAVGTLTYRDQDQVLAFGHSSMFFGGEVSFPMTAEYIQLIATNQINSFKMAAPLNTIGTITQDRRTGISGVLGPAPPMIPLDVQVKTDQVGSGVARYHFEVVDYPLFTPALMGIAGVNALLATEKMVGDATVRTQIRLSFTDYPPLTIENVFAGDQGLLSAVFRAFMPLERLMQNRFEAVSLERVAVEMQISNTIQAAELVGIRVPRNIVRPGEVIQVAADLRPYGQELVTLTESLTIPEDVHQEKLQLLVCDPSIARMFNTARAAAAFQPQSFPQLLEFFRQQISQDHLVMSLFQAKPGLVVRGRELPAPPVSMMTLKGRTERSTGKNSLTLGRIVRRTQLPTPYVVSGYAVLELTVNHYNTAVDETAESHIDQPTQGELLE